MAVRIRKLAKELGCDPGRIVEMLSAAGHAGYGDVEKQLSPSLELYVRARAKELGRVPPARPIPAARPRSGGDEDPLTAAMSGVRPLAGRSVPPPRSDPPATAPDELAILARELAGVRPLSRRVPPPAVAPPVPAAPRAPDPAEARAVELAARLAASDARAVAAEAGLAAAQARVAELEGELAELDAHRRSLQRALSDRPAHPAPVLLRELLERRGLVGDDEISLAVRAIFDARRERELLAQLRVLDAEAVEDFLWERLLLVSEGEAVPPGVVGVRVPPERSEAPDASANRAAMNRFSTACLLRNRKRIVIIGGSPAYHRVLREGIDPRLDLRLITGTRRGRVPDVPSADHVFVWASTMLDHRVSEQFPDAVVIPHRGIARMLAAATEHVEGR